MVIRDQNYTRHHPHGKRRTLPAAFQTLSGFPEFSQSSTGVFPGFLRFEKLHFFFPFLAVLGVSTVSTSVFLQMHETEVPEPGDPLGPSVPVVSPAFPCVTKGTFHTPQMLPPKEKVAQDPKPHQGEGQKQSPVAPEPTQMDWLTGSHA